MGALTKHVPKPLIRVQGQPILWYSFLSLYRHGIRNFVLPLGYKGAMIRKYIQKTSRDMACQLHCVETGEDTSIAERLLQVAPILPDGTDFLLLNSDTIFDFDLDAMYETHKRTKALVTLSSVEVVSSWGLILMKDGDVVGFDRERKVYHLVSEHSPGMEGVVNSGLAWLNKAALDLVDLRTCADFETSVYTKAIEIGRVAHFRLEGVWFPIDTPKDLAIVNLATDDRHGSGHLAKAVKEGLLSVGRQARQDDQTA